ncbi:MAG: hypothetical protein R3A48_09940 [Polyangiales bacterium]
MWSVDALKFEGCGGRIKFVAVIKDRAVVERILRDVGEDAEEPLVREGARPLRRVGLRAG